MLNDSLKIATLLPLLENSRDLIWLRGVDYYSTQFVSKAYETIWGRSRDDVSQHAGKWLNTVHYEDRQRYDDFVAALLETPEVNGKQKSIEYRIVRPDDEVRRIKELVTVLVNDAGTVVGFFSLLQDDTKEKERLTELQTALHYFRFFAAKVPAVFWVRDVTCTKQIYLSPGYEKIWGRKREEIYSNPDSWMETIHPDDRVIPSNPKRFKTIDEFGPDEQHENRYRILLPNGDVRWIKDTSFPIYDHTRSFIGFAGIAEDVTQEVVHEKELREAKETAEVANEAKSDFLAMISHEIRTPLNAILGMAQILKKSEVDPGAQEYIDIISHSGNNLLSLVSDILDFARLEAGKLTFTRELFDFKLLLEQVSHSMGYQFREKSLQFILEYAEDAPCSVYGDPNRVRQIIVNLLSNAVKFTEQGSIKLTVTVSPNNETTTQFFVAVEDTGVGIKPEKLQTVFAKFSQIDSIYQRKHRGIGLGLAITKQLVEAMGGSIGVRSEFGKGSVFHFDLYLEEAKSGPVTVTQCIGADAASSRFDANVLLVEDNLINQKIAKMMLEDVGCQVTVKSNGDEVMQELPELDKYDLVFMDVGLPDMSGFDICRAIREDGGYTRMPIIAMTAHILERDKMQAFAAGMNQVIAKPISYEQIVAVLGEYVGIREGKAA